MVREALAGLLAKSPLVNVVGQCGDGREALHRIREARPAVAVLDLSLPGADGLELCREISQKASPTRVLVLTMHNDPQFVAKAMGNGARGYLLKEAAADELLEAIVEVADGGTYFSRTVEAPGAPAMLAESEAYSRLTRRERQVLQLVAQGKTNREVAAALGLSVKTVDTHRSHLMRKLDIHDQTALVKFAIRRGIIPLR
jgi:DNA-binding NarL/FixJ family response regulator